jgi:prepilin peptidase CpaA
MFSLIIFLTFWYLGFIGGGDVKAICSFTLGVKPDLMVFYFISIGLIGAVQVVFMFAYDQLLGKLQINKGIPYGIPISISGVLCVVLSLIPS